MTKSSYSKKEKTAALFLFLADVLIMLAVWLEQKYAQVDFDQLLFQLKTTSKGVESTLLNSALIQVGLLSLLLIGLEVWLYLRLAGRRNLIFIKKHILSFTLVMFAVSLFLCSVTEMRVMSDKESVTYSYYQSNIKPKPQPVAETPTGKTIWRCLICGYEWEGEELPDDFICPICKHPKADFEKIVR